MTHNALGNNGRGVKRGLKLNEVCLNISVAHCSKSRKPPRKRRYVCVGLFVSWCLVFAKEVEGNSDVLGLVRFILKLAGQDC